MTSKRPPTRPEPPSSGLLGDCASTCSAVRAATTTSAPRLGQRQGTGPPDPPARSGDQRHLTVGAGSGQARSSIRRPGPWSVDPVRLRSSRARRRTPEPPSGTPAGHQRRLGAGPGAEHLGADQRAPESPGAAWAASSARCPASRRSPPRPAPVPALAPTLHRRVPQARRRPPSGAGLRRPGCRRTSRRRAARCCGPRTPGSS